MRRFQYIFRYRHFKTLVGSIGRAETIYGSDRSAMLMIAFDLGKCGHGSVEVYTKGSVFVCICRFHLSLHYTSCM